jgi:uncharacterized protein
MYFDPIYFLFIGPGLVIAILAQLLLKFAYGNYSRVSAGSNMTGMQAAELINKGEGFGVSFITTPGSLNDYYDPSKHVVNVSSDNATNMSVANIAVVAHEFGHVEQKMKGDSLFKVRTWLVPAVNFGSGIGMILIMIGLGIAASGVTWLGIALFATTTLFSLVTLPIEIDASRRGMKLLRKYNLVSVQNLGGAKWVLAAAALTYFAGLVQSIGQLAYFIMMAQGRSRD